MNYHFDYSKNSFTKKITLHIWASKDKEKVDLSSVTNFKASLYSIIKVIFEAAEQNYKIICYS